MVKRTIVFCTWLLCACSPSPPPTPAPKEHLHLLHAQIAALQGYSQFMRGYLRMGHEVRSFVPCGSEREYWVDDLTGANLYAVYRSLAAGSPADYAPLYIELDAFAKAPKPEGFAADYDSLLTAVELRFAARETRGCTDDIESVFFRAQGNEPFWNLEIHAEGIRVQQMGYEVLDFPVELGEHRLEQVAGNVQVYHAEVDTTHALHLRLERRSCRDSTAGTYHHFTAELELEGRVLYGCARAGALPSQ
jgi:putative lipoprotein